VLLLAGCATGPVYAPLDGRTYGYSDQQLAQNRYRIMFTGTVSTPRPEVEDYLLRRAAEVTLNAGYAAFVFTSRDTESKTSYRMPFNRPWMENPYGPYYYYGSDWYYDGYGSDFPWADTVPVTRYTAYAEIRVLTAGEAAKEPAALFARDVLDHVAPTQNRGQTNGTAPS
jgi:hypothetical protein